MGLGLIIFYGPFFFIKWLISLFFRDKHGELTDLGTSILLTLFILFAIAHFVVLIASFFSPK